jgi:hypothetical protein
MNITISEDLNSTPRGKMRFCATLNGDTNEDRGGFGSSERNALWSLAQQLNIHPGTLQVTATIERIAVR